MVRVANKSAIASAEMAKVTRSHAAATTRIAATRSRGVGRTSVNELIAVTTVSMPEYALSPMVAMRAVTDASAMTVPNPGKTRLPAS